MHDPSPEAAPTSREQGPRVGLALGGGGVLGAAWLIGALQALADAAGWDPTAADHVIGTSAGSVVGTLVASGLPPWFLAHHQTGGSVEGLRDESGRPLEDADRQARGLFRWSRSLPRMLVGSPGLAIRTALQPWRYPPATLAVGWMWQGFLSTAQIGDIVRRAAPGGWPEHPALWICAVDYATGRRVVFGRRSSPDASLAEAVEASCAIPGFYRPVRIGGRSYVDGGAWSPSNLDVLARTDVDVVIALNPMSSLNPGVPTTVFERVERRIRRMSGRRFGMEARRVRESGKQLLLIQPEADDLAAMGINLMNPRRRRLVLETATATTRRRLAEPDAAGILKLLRG